MLGIGQVAFIFNEMDKRVEDVPSTPYIKVGSPIERRLYKVWVPYYSSRKQKAYDYKEGFYLTELGDEVMRIRGSNITQRMPYILERVKTKLYKANR